MADRDSGGWEFSAGFFVGGLVGGNRIADQIRPLEVSTRADVGIIEVDADVKHSSGLEGCDARHLPAADNVTQHGIPA